MATERNDKWWHQGGWALVALPGVYLLSLVAIFYYITLPEPRYIRPHTADDWAAWGTWVGAFGTIGAVVYAARQLSMPARAAEAQRRHRREMAVEAAQRVYRFVGELETSRSFGEVFGRIPHGADESHEARFYHGSITNDSLHPIHHVEVIFHGQVVFPPKLPTQAPEGTPSVTADAHGGGTGVGFPQAEFSGLKRAELAPGDHWKFSVHLLPPGMSVVGTSPVVSVRYLDHEGNVFRPATRAATTDKFAPAVLIGGPLYDGWI